MDPDLYDEFGNYIGPDLESESDSESEEEKERDEEEEEEDMQEGEERDEEDMAQSMAIVLHEDKKYYPTAGEVRNSQRCGGSETIFSDPDSNLDPL
jgi:U5 small nuclear ribonucleoprotein component